ncbi:porin [Lichenihabitans sp. Uapishka_5]|uniref:OprO/OprP family phosphate-selective porin n=1 Tax=Lichenihabitans sp. Uapishka_5 TaxID=3037302 RepID=UPI0029E81A02|nr:porin [Lichenihabitans sp. Uapishka_5]MDX7952184.1 porin [Lichenihabitans sp. Uapishka_5]
MHRVQPNNNAAQAVRATGSVRLVSRLISGVATSTLVAAATLCAAPQAFAQTASVLAPQAARAPRHVSTRRETHPARAPESSSGQVTNANATAPTAGIFPFVPPYFTKLPGAGLSVDTKGISYATDNKDVQFRIGGRYQEEFSAASTSPRLRSTATTPLVGADGIDSRRAFFEAYLTLSNGVAVALQYDFANATQPIQDAVVSYHAPNTNVIYTIGNFKEPFSLNQLISDNNTLFTERSVMDGLVPGRNFGGAVSTYGDKWTATGGVYAGNANNTLTDNGFAGTARATYAPILEKTQLLHFGVAGSYRSLDQLATASFNSRPEDYLERALVNTGTLRNADAIERVNGEALYQFANVRLQGEYTFVNVTSTNGSSDRSFQGGYVEGGWVINGAGRPYRVSQPYGSEAAVLQGVQVEDAQRVSNGGIGVFELGLRYSALDLNNANRVAASRVTGGSEQDFTAGLNWYPDRNIRMMADYVHGWVSPASTITEVSAVRKEVESDAFVGRMQLYW